MKFLKRIKELEEKMLELEKKIETNKPKDDKRVSILSVPEAQLEELQKKYNTGVK